MLDLHLHLLPDIDDGAASLAVTEAMLRRSKQMGFDTLVTTPHLVAPLSGAYRGRIQDSFRQVNELAKRFDIELLLGYEVALNANVPRRLIQGEPITLAESRAVLVELPVGGWQHHVEDTLLALRSAGYRPVIAHPERCEGLHGQPDRVRRLVERGVMLQVTIGSLTGLFGKKAQRIAETWLRQGAVGLVASDAHSNGNRLSCVPKGLARLDRLVGPSERRRLTVEMPAALLRDDAKLPTRDVYCDHAADQKWLGLHKRLSARL